jgi:hypothetical protein
MLTLRVLLTYFQVAIFFWKTKRNNKVRLSKTIKKADIKVSSQQFDKMLAYTLFCRFVLWSSARFHQRKPTKLEEDNAFFWAQ